MLAFRLRFGTTSNWSPETMRFRALIAACWADGSVEAAEWAVTAATAAQDAVAHHVAVICGDVNLALLHPMRFLAEQGQGRIHRFLITRTAVLPVS